MVEINVDEKPNTETSVEDLDEFQLTDQEIWEIVGKLQKLSLNA